MASNVPTIKTNRLKLRNISIEDAETIVLLRADPSVYRFFLSPHKITIEEHIDWYNNIYLKDDNIYNWIAIDEKNNSIGIFGIRRNINNSETIEISYILSPSYKGYGYAREAVLAIINFFSENLNSKYIVAQIHKNNTDSIKFIKNLGLTEVTSNGDFYNYRGSIDSVRKRNNKQIFIRVDGNNIIGTGHVMRCLAIAKQLKKFNITTIFVTSDYSMEKIIEENGFEILCLNSNWNNMELELNKMCKLITDYDIEIIIIDSYYVTFKYLEKIKSIAKTYYIDDINSMKYPVNGIINYNIYSEEIKYDSKMYDNLFLGTRYTPLREEFLTPKKRTFRTVKNILITTGGTDEYNFIEHFLNFFIKKEDYADYNLFCILGRFNANIDNLNFKYKKFKNIHLLSSVDNMSYYMEKCDIAITAGGTTCYELCAMGLPSIVYTLANNQLKVANTFSQKELIYYAGDIRENMKETLFRINNEIIKLNEKDYWYSKSRKMQELVDGAGAQRIAKIIYKLLMR